MSGYYNNSVYCLGTVSIVGDTEITGDLIVYAQGLFASADLNNVGGYKLTVGGDCIVEGTFNFTPGAGIRQLETNILGDLICSVCYFKQDNPTNSSLVVRGNMTVEFGIDTTGTATNPKGNSVNVGGNLTATNLSTRGVASATLGDGSAVYAGGNLVVTGNIDVRGNDSGGKAGNVRVRGSCTTSQIYAHGGTGSAAAGPGGIGGAVNVDGSLSVLNSVDIYGGSATDQSGGNAGSLTVGGAANVGGQINAYGGSSNSTSNVHRSGSGAPVLVKGDFFVGGVLDTRGGDRTGAVLAAGALTAPRAGDITVSGNMTVDQLLSSGGWVSTTGYAPHNAGEGGVVSVGGNFVSTNAGLGNSVRGGGSTQSSAGVGGKFYVNGNVLISMRTNLLTAVGLNASGGAVAPSSPAGTPVGDGGAGGEIRVRGNWRGGGNIEASGGLSSIGNAGAGGVLVISGAVNGTQDPVSGPGRIASIAASGGACSSVVETHTAGNGGRIELGSVSGGGIGLTIWVMGGNRSGATTVPIAGSGPAGGTLIVYGPLVAAGVTADAGNTTTSVQNRTGGMGGSVTVYGLFSGEAIVNARGGNAVGTVNGGNGGTISLRGGATVSSLDSSGGQANVGGNNGAAGSMILSNVVVATNLTAQDGIGLGAAPTTSVAITLLGLCQIRSLNMTNRVGCRIFGATGLVTGYDGICCILQIFALPVKNTFNNLAGGATSPQLNPTLSASTYYCEATNGTWYRSAAGIAI